MWSKNKYGIFQKFVFKSKRKFFCEIVLLNRLIESAELLLSALVVSLTCTFCNPIQQIRIVNLTKEESEALIIRFLVPQNDKVGESG